MRYETVTAPTGEPIELAAAKVQARIDDADDDEAAYLQNTIIPAVRRATERYLRRPIRAGQYKAVLADLEQRGVLILRGYGPAVITSVSYLDAGGVRQTVPVAAYGTENVVEGVLVKPVTAWPDGTAFEIAFDAGFGAVPEDIGLAMLLLVAEFYAKREVSAVFGDAQCSAYDWLLDDYRCGVGL